MLRDARFRVFWLAQVISEAGSGVGAVAVPLTAVVMLDATAWEMGVLTAVGTLPALLLSLHAGVLVDRVPRQPILVATNLGRGAMLGLVPLAAALGWLRIEVLWGVAFAVGALALVFDIAITSFVPALVERGKLLEANATLQASGAAARVAGPGVGGWLVQAVGSASAVLVDAVSFLVAGLLVARIRVAHVAPRPARRGVRSEIGEGLMLVWNDRLLRWMVLATAVASLGYSVQQAVYVLFAVDQVGVSAPVLGVVIACGSLAGVAGAAAAGQVARVLSPGGAMAAGQFAIALSVTVLVFTPAGSGGVAMLIVAQVLFAAGLQVFSVTQISLRQAITPGHVLGRVNATRRVVVFGIQPLGALAGGALGSTLGLRTTLLLAAALQFLAVATVLASPLRRARSDDPAVRQ